MPEASAIRGRDYNTHQPVAADATILGGWSATRNLSSESGDGVGIDFETQVTWDIAAVEFGGGKFPKSSGFQRGTVVRPNTVAGELASLYLR